MFCPRLESFFILDIHPLVKFGRLCFPKAVHEPRSRVFLESSPPCQYLPLCFSSNLSWLSSFQVPRSTVSRLVPYLPYSYHSTLHHNRCQRDSCIPALHPQRVLPLQEVTLATRVRYTSDHEIKNLGRGANNIHCLQDPFQDFKTAFQNKESLR